MQRCLFSTASELGTLRCMLVAGGEIVVSRFFLRSICTGDPNFLESVDIYYDRAAQLAHVPPDILAHIKVLNTFCDCLPCCLSHPQLDML